MRLDGLDRRLEGLGRELGTRIERLDDDIRQVAEGHMMLVEIMRTREEPLRREITFVEHGSRLLSRRLAAVEEAVRGSGREG